MSERHDAHGYWLAEAGPAEPAPALEGQRSADVVVVGGGYTGLWTAWQVKRLQPEASVVVLEQEGCGVGPSGRNGGFLNGLWFSLPTLRKHFGDREAIAVARAAQRSVTEIGDFCRDQRVDAWYRQAGYLQVSTAPAWDRAWEPAMAACRELGEPDACVALDPEQVRLRCDSPIFRGAGFYKGAATVQPARLALGLARRVRERGVEVYEHSEVTSVERRGGDVVAETKHGSVRAKAAVMAGGGALARLPGMHHRLTLTSSHIVITEPVPDAARADRLDRGRVHNRLAGDGPLLPHHPGRPDRLRLGRGKGRLRRPARTAVPSATRR